MNSEMNDWENINYLNTGNPKQQKVYKILKHTNIISILKAYDPIVVGTIPIEIDVADSDIDIICNVKDMNTFSTLVKNHFSSYNFFRENAFYKKHIYTSNFECDNFKIEIYGEDNSSRNQNGFRHMIIEYKILSILGKSFQQEIIKLKNEGYKTEPAFGKLLKLKDPYKNLLKLEKLSNTELEHILKKRLK